MHPVINEVASCIRLTAAVTSLRGATTKIVGNKMESISNARLAFLWAAYTVRFGVAVMLGYGMQARTPVDTHTRFCWQVALCF